MEQNLAAIMLEINDLRAGNPTVIRVTGYYNLYLGHPDVPSDPAFQSFFADQLTAFNAMVCRVAEAGSGTCVELIAAAIEPTGFAPLR